MELHLIFTKRQIYSTKYDLKPNKRRKNGEDFHETSANFGENSEESLDESSMEDSVGAEKKKWPNPEIKTRSYNLQFQFSPKNNSIHEKQSETCQKYKFKSRFTRGSLYYLHRCRPTIFFANIQNVISNKFLNIGNY